MERLERIADGCLGYLGLFLIGAISWVAERMGPVPRPAPGARARRVSAHHTPRRAAA
jgi:hypothetical protein